MLYSFETRGFYDRNIHGAAIPADAVELTAAEYRQILAGTSAGKLIARDESGRPLLIDPPAAPLSSVERAWRDAQIAATDYLAMPDYPLTEQARADLYAYRQALRDWPQSAEFPAQEHRPQPPEWLAGQLAAA